MVPVLQFETSAFYSGVPTSSQLLSCGICNILVYSGTFTALTGVTAVNAFDGSLFFDSHIIVYCQHILLHHAVTIVSFLVSFSLVLRVSDGYLVFQCSRVETVS